MDSLDGRSARLKASTYTGQHNTEKRGYTHPCLEWDSNPWSQFSSCPRSCAPKTARPLGPANILVKCQLPRH